MSQYNLTKTYYGSIKRYFLDKNYGFINNIELGEVFFHSSRFIIPMVRFNINDSVRFEIVYALKHPGKVAASKITVIDSTTIGLVLKLGIIDDDDKFINVCKLLNSEKENFIYQELADLTYGNCTPLFKLRLWIKKYVKHFDFELFKKYHFRLQRQEAAEFKRYVKENILESKRLDFRILGPSLLTNDTHNIKTFETSWRDIGFEDKRIWVNIGDESTYLANFRWAFSRDDFNLIVTGYISKKDLLSIKLTVRDNLIISIVGLDQLKDAIKTIERSRAKKVIDKLISEGYTSKQIRNHPDFVTLTNEDLLRLFGNHECIDYLQRLQSISLDMPLIYIVEKKIDSMSRYTYESSYLFSVSLPFNSIAIIWESVKLDRATQVFICKDFEYFELINKIDDYLSSLETLKRSSLKSNSDDGQLLRKELSYRTSIQHTQYDIEKWKRNLLIAIPELRSVLELVDISIQSTE